MYFTHRDRNYVTLLFSLCAAIGSPQPVFETYGTAMFTAKCCVHNMEINSINAHSRKAAAKEDAAKVAFNLLCNLPDVGETFFIHKPNFAVSDSRQQNTKVSHQASILELISSQFIPTRFSCGTT